MNASFFVGFVAGALTCGPLAILAFQVWQDTNIEEQKRLTTKDLQAMLERANKRGKAMDELWDEFRRLNAECKPRRR